MASSIAFPTEAAPSRLRGILAQGWRWLAIAGAALVLAGAAIVVTRSHWFHVRDIEVTRATHLSRGEIVRLSGITKRDNAVWLDGSAAEARLTANPWVAAADVQVDLPWTVTISLTERSPIAVLERGEGEVLVAADGTLLGSGPHGELPTIEAPPPWVPGASAPSIEGVARALAALPADLRATVRRVDAGSPEGLDLILSDGLRISYGSPSAFQDKARAIAEVLSWAGATGEQIRSLDVSAPTAPAVVLAG